MKKLTNCELMDIIDKKYDLKGTILNFKETGNIVPLNKMAHHIDNIRRKFKYPLASKVIEDLEKGLVCPVFSEELMLPKFFPVWGKQENGKLKVYTNLTPYRGVKYDNKGFLDGDIRIIYSLLQAGSIYAGYIENYKKIIGNLGFLKYCMIAYTKLFIKVLDKLYGIRLNKIKANIIAFSVAKFFLINICEKENNETTNNLAFNVCEPNINDRLIKDFDKNFKTEEIYKNLSSFLLFLSSSEDMLKNLTMREFYQNWMAMYDFSTILIIELLEHLLITIGHVIVGANIVRVSIIDNLLKNELLKIYTELSIIIK